MLFLNTQYRSIFMMMLEKIHVATKRALALSEIVKSITFVSRMPQFNLFCFFLGTTLKCSGYIFYLINIRIISNMMLLNKKKIFNNLPSKKGCFKLMLAIFWLLNSFIQCRQCTKNSYC
ncbi:hypothetical protein A359_06230 [secondary endosymbiont of Ctenarytaina eucalypti]|uniref:Uncharacterized protein n=1 Tax=secondary endosymbiont of Ctenarytaina eucalypti TaxID=1199245 RepID=J3TXP7_9ENTR|nr:hypothetical protein A359_06230 [secondary endosymbiont of Ctenarytaina eucalypti]